MSDHRPKIHSLRLATRDATDYLGSLPAEFADVVFLDPPFNLRKQYGRAVTPERSGRAEYESYLREVLVLSVRILRPGGALWMYHLPYWAARLSPLLLETLEFRHWIAVVMKNGFARGRRLYPAHYALLYLTKGEPTYFHRPRMAPVVCRKCGTTVRDYGGYRDVIEERGVNLGDVWDDLSPVRHPANKHRKENELPEALTDRVVAISGAPGAVLVDPFVGSGTSAISALKAGMIVRANDLDPEAVTITRRRARVLFAESAHVVEEHDGLVTATVQATVGAA